ncbi:MAG: hypothetical protein M3Y43_07535, partial [Pseudomonadota bacterium]|nr:hypothetical protein [Pseudomonadota bacterium]
MRIFMTIAAGAALAFGPVIAAHAQTATTPESPVETPGQAPVPATPPAAAPESPAAAAPAITSVTVVDVQELP